MNNSDDNEEEHDGQHEEDDGQDKEDDGQLEPTCFDCNNFFPDLLSSMPTEFGICLNDKAFDPFIEEMLDNENFECCRELIQEKRFDGNCDTCEDFEQCETIDLE